MPFHTVTLEHPKHGRRQVEYMTDTQVAAEAVVAQLWKATQWKVISKWTHQPVKGPGCTRNLN